MGFVATTQRSYRGVRAWVGAFLSNEDPLAAIANTGSFLVWSNQPFYPLYVWFLVGAAAWPSLLTWISTPFFVAVAIVGREHPLASRALFVIAGVLNTLLSIKAFGTASAVEWFLLPCFIIAATFFRRSEWRVSLALTSATAAAGLLVPLLGAPLQSYDAAQYRSLSHLNLWSVAVLSLYLSVAAIRARRVKTRY
jgi:hypothetical protein